MATTSEARRAERINAEKRTGPHESRTLVLLATHNGGRWIQRQLETVLAQQGCSIQVLVRDDASADDTRDIVDRISSRDPRVRRLPDYTAAGSAAANFFRLILSVTGEAFDQVAFCDQDDEWNAAKLDQAVRCMRAFGADGYSSGVQARWPSGRTRSLLQNASMRNADYLFEGAGQGCTFVISRGLFGRLQGMLRAYSGTFSRLHYHDWAIYAVARTLGLRWYIDSRITMIYHQHDHNDTGARTSASGLSRRLGLIREGWYRAQVTAIVQLVSTTNPDDALAAKWQAMASGRQGLWKTRWRKLNFVAANGRRRLLDRCILCGAVLLGYL